MDHITYLFDIDIVSCRSGVEKRGHDPKAASRLDDWLVTDIDQNIDPLTSTSRTTSARRRGVQYRSRSTGRPSGPRRVSSSESQK